MNAKKQTVFPGRKFRKIFFACGLVISFDLLLSGRSLGIGWHTYTSAAYYLYALLAISVFIGSAHRTIAQRAQITILAAIFITSHILCSFEEHQISHRKPLTQPTPRLFAQSCWIAYNHTSGHLEAGD